jgi:hypothetical protein
MGFLNLFKPGAEGEAVLPSGSFTVDRAGAVVASTISSRFPEKKLTEISAVMLAAFAEARNAGLAVGDLTFTLGVMSIRAVEMHSGAMIFLTLRRS